MHCQLGGRYSVGPIDVKLYDQFRKIHEPIIFPNRFDINVAAAFTDAEKRALEKLAQRALAEDPYELRLGFFFGDELVGWSYGTQVGSDTFRMVTSGIVPAHQRQGVYSNFLRELACTLEDAGFQMIFSRHYATDNQVIVPKLRFGFLISGFEVTEEFGLLLRLAYFFNPVRRKVMHVRSGLQQPDDEVRALIRKY